MRIKSCPVVSCKVSDDPDEAERGIVEALVATWDLDSVGDRITKGAFADDVSDWAKRAEAGSPQPFIWSHMHADPNAHVGWVLSAKETDKGLHVKAQLDIDNPPPTSYAPQVWRLIKGGRITQFSFAYDVLEGGHVDQKNEDGSDASYYELRKLKTYECGPCLIGANQATELISAKSADGTDLRVQVAGVSASASEAVQAAVTAALGAVDGKAGRTLSAKHEDALREARDMAAKALERLDGVLSAVPAPDTPAVPDPGATGDEKPSSQPAPGGAAGSTPAEGKSGEPAPNGSAPADRHRLIDTRAELERFALDLELL